MPTSDERREWRETAEEYAEADPGFWWPPTVLALLDALDAAEAERDEALARIYDLERGYDRDRAHRVYVARLETRLAAVAALAEKWEAADGEPVSTEGWTALNVTNRCGRELRAVLDRIEVDHDR